MKSKLEGGINLWRWSFYWTPTYISTREWMVYDLIILKHLQQEFSPSCWLNFWRIFHFQGFPIIEKSFNLYFWICHWNHLITLLCLIPRNMWEEYVSPFQFFMPQFLSFSVILEILNYFISPDLWNRHFTSQNHGKHTISGHSTLEYWKVFFFFALR